MVTIREIKRIRSMCCMILDSGEQYWLRQDDFAGTGFLEGSTYDTEIFLQTVRICQYPHALNHAVSMLARRPCSKKEIADRLIRIRYSEEVAGLVVFKLEKEKLLNDEEFCDQWIHSRLTRHLGLSAIKRELKLKGIPEEMIYAAFNRLDPDEEQDNALILARKAWKRVGYGEDVRLKRQKVIASLVRKGYDWDTARSACETAEQEAE